MSRNDDYDNSVSSIRSDVGCGLRATHILERGAAAGIRPIIVRQERTGLHMADAMSRVTSGRKLGVFVMQHGPGTENAYGGVAQAWSVAEVLRGLAKVARA